MRILISVSADPVLVKGDRVAAEFGKDDWSVGTVVRLTPTGVRIEFDYNEAKLIKTGTQRIVKVICPDKNTDELSEAQVTKLSKAHKTRTPKVYAPKVITPLQVAAEDFEQCPVTEENIKRFVQWYIAVEKNPKFVKAAKTIKAVKAAYMPGSSPNMGLGVNVDTKTLWVNPHTQWGPASLSRTSGRELTHELGHLIWHVVKDTPAGKAFTSAVLSEAGPGKYISQYQEIHHKRARAKQTSEFVFVHESFAEWSAKGPSNRVVDMNTKTWSADTHNAKTMPKQHTAFLKALAEY